MQKIPLDKVFGEILLEKEVKIKILETENKLLRDALKKYENAERACKNDQEGGTEGPPEN